MFTTGPLFRKLSDARDAGVKIVVLQGGQWSGKTYASLQYYFAMALREPGAVFTVVGRDVPFLKRGAIRDAIHIWKSSEDLKRHIITYNQTDKQFQFRNGSVVEFAAYEDEHDAKGAKRKYLYINEADFIPWEIAWQLISRTEVMSIIDYNPTAEFWCHTKILNNTDGTYNGLPIKLFISDHRHNPFIPQAKHDEIESIPDKQLWRVYARGLTGNLKGSIFPNWQFIEAFPPDCDEVIYGIDYGYTIDPTALVKVGFKQPNTLYLDELSYTPGIDEFQIETLLKASGWDGDVLYSEHDKEMALNLRRIGVPVILAHKGEGSVKAGILKMKRYNVFYTVRSVNLHRERLAYRWEYVGDVPTNKPMGTADHLIDASRYAIATHNFDE